MHLLVLRVRKLGGRLEVPSLLTLETTLDLSNELGGSIAACGLRKAEARLERLVWERMLLTCTHIPLERR